MCLAKYAMEISLKCHSVILESFLTKNVTNNVYTAHTELVFYKATKHRGLSCFYNALEKVLPVRLLIPLLPLSPIVFPRDMKIRHKIRFYSSF